MNTYAFALQVHNKVNSEKQYREDWLLYGVPDYWTPDGKYGDCEDYALAKRNALLAAGWDKNKLGLCVCLSNGNGHCCLWVDTDKGSFILDNNYAFPVKPSELPYKWESMLCNGEWLQLNGFA